LDQVEEAIEQLDWEEVPARAHAVLPLDPENADAINFLASAERALGSSAPPPTTPRAMATSATAPVHPTSPSAEIRARPEPAEGTSFANGRYQVKQLLGEGGKKKVYLAHDGNLDRGVALAVIKSEGLDDLSRTRITREAQAMGRLGDHPNILQIHDLGEDNGQPYLVLPLMTGGSIEAVPPFSSIPTQYRITVDGQQKWFGQ